jgi:hypothetical protein
MLDGAVITGAAAIAYSLAGPLAALVTGSAFVYARLKSNIVTFPIPIKDYDIDERSPLERTLELDETALLISPAEPPQILHGPNTCFLASALQVILGEQLILDELPAAIARRLVPEEMFIGPMPIKIQELIQKKPLTRDILLQIKTELQKLEKNGFPENRRCKILSLITLLELYELVSSQGTISREQIDSMRKMVGRVNPCYAGNKPGSFGDPYAVLSTLGSLIFKGSRHEQKLTTCKFIEPANHGLDPIDADKDGNIRSVESNWGHFELHIPDGYLHDHLNQYLNSEEIYQANYATSAGGEEKYPFTVDATTLELEFAPELLVLKNASQAKVDIENERLKVSFGIGKVAEYALRSMVTCNNAHCTAVVARERVMGNVVERNWHHIDDMRNKGVAVPISDIESLAKKKGYVFIYKKIKDLPRLTAAAQEEKKCILM